MQKFKIPVLAILFLLFSFASVHKYYVSVTHIDYVKEKQSVQIITRIFVDDFERLLRERYDETITLATEEDEKQIDQYIKKYLLSKIKISINGEEEAISFLGKEYEDDIMNCYLEIENIPDVKTFEVENKVLYDVFEDQKNIVRTNINNNPKAFVLILENDKGLLNFN